MKLLPWSKLSSFLFHLSAMAFVTAIAAQDETISGNLTVNGQTDIIAGPLTLGTANHYNDDNILSSTVGYTISYQDVASYGDGGLYTGGISTITHQGSHEGTRFLWKFTNANNWEGLDESLMSLSRDELAIYPNINGYGYYNTLPNQSLSSSAAIVTRILGDARYLTKSGGTITGNLVVNGTATFSSLTSNFTGSGTDNRLPNQVANNEHSIITKGIADSNYLPAMGDNTIRIGGGSNAVDWSGAIAIGSLASAGENAVAIGNHAGHWTISGLKSVAIGYAARAPGNYAIAIGEVNWGAGEDAIVIGRNAESAWSKAIAIGTGAQASQVNQVVIGTYNMPSPASGGLSPTNDLFILGNGTGPETENRSNALIVKRNGNMEVKGTSLKVDGIEVLKENSTRYVQVREDNTIVGGAMAGTDPWSGGIALGYQAWAGSNALSIGNLAGTSSHSGEYSISVGREAKSLGNSSVAVGRGPLAGSTNSTAIGQFAGTYAEQAIAIGTDVKANQVGQIVLGAYNQQTSPSTLRAPTDALFILGSGTANDSRSNALIVKRNGNMEVKGNSLTVNGAEVLTLASLDAAVENINLTNGNYISRNVTIGMYYGTSATAAPHSIALGEQATASGTQSSSAIGFNARSNQTGTHALGNHLVANRPGQIVLGNYNAYGSSLAGSSTAAPEDPVFIVGNGTSDSVRSNALLIRRNGNIELTGSSLTFNGSAFLTQTTADTRYLTQASASTAYLTQASADTRYLTPTAATALYQPLLPTGTTYLTTADLIPLQTDIDSKIGLVELETEIDDALGDALTNLDLTGNYLSKDPQTGLAYGTGSTAAAPSSASIGTQLVANQPGQVVVGAYNRYSAPPSTPQPQDALFVVGAGNGVAEDPDERKNAFEVRRNGDASVSGVLRVPEAGDLSMGAFTDGLTPFPDAD